MQNATTPIPQLTPKQQVNFWKKIDRNGPQMPHMESRCWTWTAHRNKHGYGKFGISSGRMFNSHRIAFVLGGGELSEDKPNACHHCDNPSCCRFDHIYAGSKKDNAADRERRGRGNKARALRNGKYTKPECTPRGSAVGGAKLTADKVKELRIRYHSGETYASLRSVFPVCRSAFYCVIRRKTWAHVP